MANWSSFGGRSMRKRTRYNCFNRTAGFHHSTSGGSGGLLSPVRSSEYFLGVGGRSVGELKRGAPFLSIQRCFSPRPCAQTVATGGGVVVVEEEEARGPLPLRSAPCLMLPAGTGLVAEHNGGRYKLVKTEDNKDYYQFFSLRDKKVVKMRKNPRLVLPWQWELLPSDEAICFGSSRGWLAYIHPRNCSLYLFNPFVHSYLPYLPLPPIHTLPCILSSERHSIDSIYLHTVPCILSSERHTIDNTFSVQEPFKNKYVSSQEPFKNKHISSQELSDAPFFKKIALSSSPSPFPSNHHRLDNNDDRGNENKKHSSDCTVMAIQGYGEHNLAFCRIGDTEWTPIRSLAPYQDVVYFSKVQKFYALSTDHEFIQVWDLSNRDSPRNSLIVCHFPPRVRSTNDLHRYLVESSGELLMVVRYHSTWYDDGRNYDKTIKFDVYKLDIVEKEWLLLPSLGDRALFVGLNDSISVSATDFPGLAMNCIYFTCPGAENSQDSHDLGVFNLVDSSITPIYHYDPEIQLPSPWIVPAQQ